MSSNNASSSPIVYNEAGDLLEAGTRVVMKPGKRWQGVGTLNRIHDNGTTCAVKWDSGRIDRSLLISDLLVKKVGGGAATPSKTASDAPATPAGVQTPSKQDQSYTSSASSAPTTPTQDRSAQQPAISSPAPPTASAASSGAASRRAGPGTANDKAPNKAKAGGVGKVVAVVGVIAAVGAVVAFNVLKKK